MNEFIRDNLVFVAQGSKLDPLNQRATIVEYFPSRAGEPTDTGKCTQILLSLEEGESLYAYLGAWLQENAKDA